MSKKKKRTKKKSKSTETKKSKSKKTKAKKSKKNKPRIIFLYASHESIVNRCAERLTNYGADDSIRLRKQLNIKLSDHVLPVYPYPAKARIKVVEQLQEIEGTTIVVLGLSTDQQFSGLHKLYADAEVVWVHPPEKQFHIDMMRVSNDIPFHEAEKRMHEWLDFLKKHFDEDDIKIVR